jgi:hypothetical protein
VSQPDFSTTPRREAARPAWESLLLAAAALALVGSGWAAVRARNEATEAAARVTDARRQLDVQQTRLRALAPLAGDFAAAAAETPPRRIVGAIAGILPGDARLSHLTIDYQRGIAVEMRVDARRAAAWDRLLAQMERSSDFVEVESGPEDREGEIETTLRARWARGAR